MKMRKHSVFELLFLHSPLFNGFLRTLVVNATTSPLLVSVLGITRWESAKQSMMLMLHSRLKAGWEFSDRKLRKFGSPDPEVAQVFESGFPAETSFNSHPPHCGRQPKR